LPSTPAKSGDQVAAPIGEQKLVSGDYQKDHGNVVAETVFASEEVKELALVDAPARMALRKTIIAKLSNDLLVG